MLPLVIDGTVVGAIGVGVGTEKQDMEIANYVKSVFTELVSR